MPNRSMGDKLSEAEAAAVTTIAMTELEWEAIVGNDSAYDGHWFYAVKSTGIFCRPSCKSRPPSRPNVSLFRTAEHASAAGFRPCKRCKPTGQRLPDEEWMDSITEYIHVHYTEPITLDSLAVYSHSSPYHLQRTFKRLKGLTPLAYIQQLRLQDAMSKLAGTPDSIAQIGQLIGMPNSSYFITWFKKMSGHTPMEYRQLIHQEGKEPHNGEHDY